MHQCAGKLRQNHRNPRPDSITQRQPRSLLFHAEPLFSDCSAGAAPLNRLIRGRDLDMIFISGPGHGAPSMLSQAWLEGTYGEVYPNKGQGEDGLTRFFKQFSFPGGIGSHCTPETPGSLHEGGELGYSLSHAFGVAFDNPDLIVACMIGDGESETGPLATAWHRTKFLNPTRDGAVLPILHLNGYKIANPTVLARIRLCSCS